MRADSFSFVSVCAVAVLGSACASKPDVDPFYQPTENVLEVIAVLRAHVSDDTYRFEAARDFTGRNVYRSSLLRLENMEKLHADALRAGHMDGVILFAKARALERLQAFDLAAESYRLSANLDDTLGVEALRSADVCDVLQRAAQLAPDFDAAITPQGNDEALEGQRALRNLDWVLENFEQRVALLNDLSEATRSTHHYPIIQEEIERTDVARASYFVGVRKISVDGDVRAVAELQRVITKHPESKRLNRHLLELANLYADLSAEYAAAYPPASLRFDPVHFRELVDGAAHLYQMVASRDGTPEKLEAARRLEAFLAFSIQIDRDRFTP